MHAESYEGVALIIHLYNSIEDLRSWLIIKNMFTWELVDHRTDTSRIWYPKWESGASKCGGDVN